MPPPVRARAAAGPGVAGGDDGARIGPNAVIRVAEALAARGGDALVARVFAAAGLDAYVATLPTAMVAEGEVTRLHAALRSELGVEAARAVSREAGRLTGDYLLRHRIPRPAQALLRLLPAPLAARALIGAIVRNRWTFCGSAALAASAGNPVRFRLARCAIARGARAEAPVCDYYAATFEQLFRALVRRDAVATETECEAAGGGACVFEVRW